MAVFFVVYLCYQVLKKSRRFRIELFNSLNTLGEQVLGLEKKLEVQTASLEAMLGEQVLGLEKELEVQTASLEAKLEKKLEVQTASLEAKLEKKLEFQAASLEAKLGEQVLGLEKKLAVQKKSLDEISRHMRLSDRHQFAFFKQMSSEFTRLAHSNVAVNDSLAGQNNTPTIRQKIIEHNQPVTIVVAGMRHSGSTAIFNLIRFLFEQYNIDFESGYSEYKEYENMSIRSDKVRIIKTHELRDDVQLAADFIITARRDLRDTVASAVRRDFKMLKQLGSLANYAKYNRALHDLWSQKTNFEVIYDDFKKNEHATVGALCESLGFADTSIEALLSLINNIPKDQYADTLLTDSHITDPSNKLTYCDTLSKEDIMLIEQQNFHWLAQYEYIGINS
jgi:hypothetical protein